MTKIRIAMALGAALFGFTAACGQDIEPERGSPADELGTVRLALTGLQESFGVTAVAFSAVDENGEGPSAVIPLEEEPLPAARDAEAAGGDFADWLVVLPPGAYTVTATPLGPQGEPSKVCGAAMSSAVVTAGTTTEITLVSRCNGAGTGALDSTVVFESGPVIDGIDLETSKFVCASEAFAATISASLDGSTEGLSWSWAITGLPEGATMNDACLTWSEGRAALSAGVPGKWEVTVTVSADGASSRLAVPVYVSDCNDVLACFGPTALQSLGTSPAGEAGRCTCDDDPGQGPTGSISTPSGDSGRDNPDFVYDGFDDASGLWFKDVSLAGMATDAQDGALSGAALVWRTNRNDLQDPVLGTGESLTARLWSNSCFGVEHEIILEATDSDGNTVQVGRRLLFIWTLC